MRVLVACEFSGVVREAFLALGHDAYSCDVLPSNHLRAQPGRHLQQDVTPLLDEEWDLVIAHPPCTYLASIGARWFTDSQGKLRLFKMWEAAEFFMRCLKANSPRVCVENPRMMRIAQDRIGVSYTQIIHPWQFGHPDTKQTCLWLRGLPPLEPTNVVTGRNATSHMVGGSSKLKKSLIRSITYSGIAAAMSTQWGGLAEVPNE